VDGGIGRQRTADGTMITREYHVGDTNYSDHSPDEPMIHDFENAGDTPIRFTTVELLDQAQRRRWHSGPAGNSTPMAQPFRLTLLVLCLGNAS
jgi:hypothetical protein